MIRGYRKQASWAQAGELAAVAELATRRRDEALGDGARDGLAADAATDEIAAALTLTGRAAQLLTGRAIEIAGLPLTFAALADGQIDMPKALVLLTGLAGQEPELARTIEAEVIDRAAAQTTGQLRASLNRALLAADPAAAERRRQREEKFARVEQTPEPGGLTAALTGRYLPVTASVAAWNRISDLARQLKTAGADGHLDELRVQVYLALLTGQALNVAGAAASGDTRTPENAQTSRDVGTAGDADARADSDPGATAIAPADGRAPGDVGVPGDAGAPADSDPGATATAPEDGSTSADVGVPGDGGAPADSDPGATGSARADGRASGDVGVPGDAGAPADSDPGATATAPEDGSTSADVGVPGDAGAPADSDPGATATAPEDGSTSADVGVPGDASAPADSDPGATATAPEDGSTSADVGVPGDASAPADSDPGATAAMSVNGSSSGDADVPVDGEFGSASAATVDGAASAGGGEPGATSAGPVAEDRASAVNGVGGANGTRSGGDGDGTASAVPPGLGGSGRPAGLGGPGQWAGLGEPERLTGLGGPTRLTGTVNLTVPLATLLGITDAPGELGTFGPVTAHTAREIAAAAVDAPAIRWCVTVTGEDGIPIGHGCARPVRRGRRTGVTESGDWAFDVKLRALAAAECGHERESPNYRPPPSLWHLIQIRNQRCTHAGCRMPAGKCDDDHTLPYEKGGRTCECNLAPLCRHHHRVKQLQGWRLEQPEPGVLAWVTPSGWTYLTGPATYAA